jgi:acyl-coenzyme A synthetase/AMP-(fatty) acid ligase
VFSTQNQCVIDGNRNVVPKGQPGELCVAGSQITEGYLNNPVKTREQFIQLPGKDCVWYRTGDLVMEYPDGCLQYLGRIDDQVQVCGHRVELQEVDHALRQACQTDQAVSVAWPPASGRADAIYAFICAAPDFSTETVIAHCKGVMPDYMIPRRIFVIDQMPLNVNGKIDRASLAQRVGGLINAE